MSGVERNVLLIEDDDTDALFARQALEGAPDAFDLTRVKDFRAALQAIAETEFEVVVADLRLPDIDSRDIVPRLVAAAPTSTIIVLTGTDDDEVGRRMVQAGAHEYAVKTEATYRLLPRLIDFARERQRTREELVRVNTLRATSIQLVQTMLSLSTEAFLLLDRGGKILVANPAFCRLTRYPLKSLVGRAMSSLFHAGAADKSTSRFMSQLMSGRGNGNGAMKLRLADGAVRAFSYWMAVVSSGGEHGHVIVKLSAANLPAAHADHQEPAALPLQPASAQ